MDRIESWIKRLLVAVAATRRECGQAAAEFALVLAVVLLGCIVAVTVIGLAVNGYFVDLVDAFT